MLGVERRVVTGGRFGYIWDAIDKSAIKTPSRIYFYKLDSDVFSAPPKKTPLKIGNIE